MSYQDLSIIKKGFTLVELLVVVSIVGLLSTLIVISLNDTKTKSHDARRLADINDFQKALELYSADFNVYPVGTNLVLGSANVGCLSASGFTAVCPGGARVYMGIVPANPGSGGIDYNYTSPADGQTYTIDFRTETDVSDIPAGDHVLVPAGIQ
jgi:prepilin-type N-terminal cleavage/methylation domain-containing protein